MNTFKNLKFLFVAALSAVILLSLFLSAVMAQSMTGNGMLGPLDAGLTLTPDNAANADPGATIHYTHTLANTGDMPDVVTITVSSSPGFTATVEPEVEMLDIGASITVTATVTVAADAAAGNVGITLVTATSGNDDTVSASATNTTTVNLVADLLLSPESQSQNAGPGSLVPYLYLLTNNGNATDAYTLTLHSSQGYDVALSANFLTLAASASENVTVTVTIPADAEAGTVDETTVTVTSGNDPSLAKIVTSTTHVTLVPGVAITPDNEGFAPPGQTAVYTHTVTNNSNRMETISLAAASSRGWAATVQPTSLTLNRNESDIVTVTIPIPSVAVEGISDTTVVTAALALGHYDTAHNVTMVRRYYLYLPAVTRPANWEQVGANWPVDVAALSLAVCPTDNSKMIAGGLGADAKVWTLEGTSWEAADSVPSGFSVAAVVMNQACNKAYAGLYNQGIWQGVWNGTTWAWSPMGGDEVKLVRTLALADDRLFAGGEFGILYWENDAWQETNGVDTAQPVMHISAGDPTDANSLLYAVQWQNSKIYYALGNFPSAWNLLPLPDLPDALTRVVFGTSATVRFVGTNNSSYQLVNNNWAQISIPAGLRSAVIDGDTAYLGYNLNTGVYKLQGGVLTPVDAGWSTKPEFVYVLALAEGQLYAATTTGVWVYQRP